MQEPSRSASAMQPPKRPVGSLPIALLAMNAAGAILYVFAASRGGWAIPAERAAGINTVTGEPFVWALHIFPIVAVFFVINVVWAISLARKHWSGGRFWLLPAAVWLLAVVIDFAHH